MKLIYISTLVIVLNIVGCVLLEGFSPVYATVSIQVFVLNKEYHSTL